MRRAIFRRSSECVFLRSDARIPACFMRIILISFCGAASCEREIRMKRRGIVITAVVANLPPAGCTSPELAPEIGACGVRCTRGSRQLCGDQIRGAFETRLELCPPLAAGIAWFEDSQVWGPNLPECARAGVPRQKDAALCTARFTTVSALPTPLGLERGAEGARSIDAFRSGAQGFDSTLPLFSEPALPRTSV